MSNPAEKSRSAPVRRIDSTKNPRIKSLIRLRKRSVREAERRLLIEGYRECLRAIEAGHPLRELYHCSDLYLGTGGNESKLADRALAAGAQLFACSEAAFRKVSYRDRPDGLLAVGDYLSLALDELPVPDEAIYVIAEAVEKPGNLGTLLRSADAAGVNGLIVCDPCTDLHNPNVVRASVGTLFTVPVAEADTDSTLAWLRQHQIRGVATSPDAETLYFNADLRGPIALAVGTEQYGLSDTWLQQADLTLRIPMRGKADSLNVASAATLIMYEALRQRG